MSATKLLLSVFGAVVCTATTGLAQSSGSQPAGQMTTAESSVATRQESQVDRLAVDQNEGEAQAPDPDGDTEDDAASEDDFDEPADYVDELLEGNDFPANAGTTEDEDSDEGDGRHGDADAADDAHEGTGFDADEDEEQGAHTGVDAETDDEQDEGSDVVGDDTGDDTDTDLAADAYIADDEKTNAAVEVDEEAGAVEHDNLDMAADEDEGTQADEGAEPDEVENLGADGVDDAELDDAELHDSQVDVSDESDDWEGEQDDDRESDNPGFRGDDAEDERSH